jgi:carbonic anhydrase
MITGAITHTPTGACACAACDDGRGAGPLGPLGRRRFLTAGALAVLAGGAVGLSPRVARAQTTLSPDGALEQLMAGNARFTQTKLTSFDEDLDILRKATVEKQEPFAAVLSCADSRVPSELVFDQSIGHLFVTRVAGNVATSDVIASLEYGAAVLGVRAIVVLGHQGCGAVKAAIYGKPVPGQISTLFPPLQLAVEQGGHDVEATGKANAKIQADILANASTVLSGLIKEGKLKIVPAYYGLDTGKVSLLA